MIPILLGAGSSPALRDLAGTSLGLSNSFPGAKRKTTGAFEGDHS